MEEEDGKALVPPLTRARSCGAVRVGASHGFWKLRVMLPSLSVALATTPGRHFAADRVSSFAEGRIG